MLLLILFLPSMVLCQYARLGSYNIDKGAISVTGFSSGGKFVSNFIVANSASYCGAAIIAGYPYGCDYPFSCEDVQDQIAYAQNNSDNGLIDNVSNLRDKPIYVFQGLEDLFPENGHLIKNFFEAFGAKIATNLTSGAGHGMPHLNYGVQCDLTFYPFVNDCGWMAAYHTLHHMYGELVDPGADTAQTGQWLEFDQTEFTEGEDGPHSFDEAGYAYIPSDCKDTENQCKLHVHFHGCAIGRWFHGDDYARHTGFNEVGEVNRMITLYPQLKPNEDVANPVGCFGWPTEPNHDLKSGTEIRIVQKMVDRVASGSP